MLKGLQIQSALWNGEGKRAPHIYDSLSHTLLSSSFLSQFISISLSHEHTYTFSLMRARALSLSINPAHSPSLSVSCCIQRTHTLTAVTSFIRFFCFRTGFYTNITTTLVLRFSALIGFHFEINVSFSKDAHWGFQSIVCKHCAFHKQTWNVIIISIIPLYLSRVQEKREYKNTSLKTLEATTDCYCFSVLAFVNVIPRKCILLLNIRPPF